MSDFITIEKKMSGPPKFPLKDPMPRSCGYKRIASTECAKTFPQTQDQHLTPATSAYICDQIFNDSIQAVCSETTLDAMRAAAQRFTAYGYGL